MLEQNHHLAHFLRLLRLVNGELDEGALAQGTQRGEFLAVGGDQNAVAVQVARRSLQIGDCFFELRLGRAQVCLHRSNFSAHSRDLRIGRVTGL